jgi:hypothetical protein
MSKLHGHFPKRGGTGIRQLSNKSLIEILRE